MEEVGSKFRGRKWEGPEGKVERDLRLARARSLVAKDTLTALGHGARLSVEPLIMCEFKNNGVGNSGVWASLSVLVALCSALTYLFSKTVPEPYMVSRLFISMWLPTRLYEHRLYSKIYDMNGVE